MSTNVLTIEELAAIITKCAGVDVEPGALAAEPLTSFADLDVDSLGVLGVVAEIERRYSVALGGDAEECETPRELVALVNEQLSSAV
jgi:minimal PKS acyl carrier protein